MAERPKGYGMTAELSAKRDAKYDEGAAREAKAWIQAVTGVSIPGGADGRSLHESLKDGVVLCKLIMALSPGTKIKINESKMAFKQMENIGRFLDACSAYGCAKADMFQTVDLFENQNMAQVVNALHALGRKAQAKGYSGPTLGPKESEKKERNFTEEQLREGQNVIGLQMGTNKGASQSGQNFGLGRQIINK